MISRALNVLWNLNYRFSQLGVVACLALFVIAIIGGLGWKSLVPLCAAVYWLLRARGDKSRMVASNRHHELRRSRLERDRARLDRASRRDAMDAAPESRDESRHRD